MELYALSIAVLTWSERITNGKFVIFCDNQSVCRMVDNITSGCGNCMHLMRIIVLDNLKKNRRLAVNYVRTVENVLADALSRLDMKCFWDKAPETIMACPDPLPKIIWPVDQLWKLTQNSRE